MKRRYLLAILVLAALVLVVILGPQPAAAPYSTALPELPSAAELEHYIEAREDSLAVKPENEARIVWADPVNKTITPYCLLYLHGFSASQREGFPLHRLFAKRYGCNMYLSRLQGHGLSSSDPLLELTAQNFWLSAVEAYAIARKLGREVIVMSTSTGGTLGLLLAAHFDHIAALINYSPNLAINDPFAWVLNDPWGLQIARLVFGSDYREIASDSIYRRYWYDRYRLEGVVALQELVEHVSNKEVIEQITCPVFTGVYYRDETHQDPVVKVAAARDMHRWLGTADSAKVLLEFPKAHTHVIACDLKSESIAEVKQATYAFAEGVLQLQATSP